MAWMVFSNGLLLVAARHSTQSSRPSCSSWQESLGMHCLIWNQRSWRRMSIQCQRRWSCYRLVASRLYWNRIKVIIQCPVRATTFIMLMTRVKKNHIFHNSTTANSYFWIICGLGNFWVVRIKSFMIIRFQFPSPHTLLFLTTFSLAVICISN